MWEWIGFASVIVAGIGCALGYPLERFGAWTVAAVGLALYRGITGR